MNTPEDPDLTRRLRQLEAEIDPPASDPRPVRSPQSSSSPSFNAWFNSLPSTGKLVAFGVLAFVGLSVVGVALRILHSVIQLAVLGGLLYLGYRLFVAPRSNSD